MDVIDYKNYAEVDLGALCANYRLLSWLAWEKDKRATPICVIKADGYGHGAAECARALREAGADFFAVSDIGEALEVRAAVPKAKIIVLGYVKPKNAPLLAKHNIIQGVHSIQYARELENELKNIKNAKLSIHIKLDTGMARLGFPTGDALFGTLSELSEIATLGHLKIDGVYSHLACADDEKSDKTERQLALFDEAVAEIKKNHEGICTHICNSAGAVRFGGAGHDYYRLGITLYGYSPSPSLEIRGLSPVMTLYSTVAQVHTLKKGEGLGYGADFVAERDTAVATLSLGYADGILRACRDGYVKINGSRAKILGRICMDQLMVCVDGIEVSEGDIAVIYDASGECMADLARSAETVSYELLCAVGKRVPRIYKQ